MIKQVISQCCGVKVCRFGNRRRQCSSCKKTWSVNQKKRGRPRLRVSSKLALRTLETAGTLRIRAIQSGLSLRQYQYRFKISVGNIDPDILYTKIPKSGSLILLIDGFWIKICGVRYIVYCVAVRPVNGIVAFLLPPVVLHGVETSIKWRSVIQNIPQDIYIRCKVIVCDGLTGLHNQGLPLQRCHVHMFRVFYRFLGLKNRNVKHKVLRRNIWNTLRKAVSEPDPKLYQEHRKKLVAYSKRQECPKWIMRQLHEYLRHDDSFRTYLTHPKWKLPNTNNTMESLCALLRKRFSLSRGFRTLPAAIRWVLVLIIQKKTVVCRPSIQQNICR